MAEARQKIPFTSKIEIEAETFEQAKIFMAAGADIVMCDNMTPEQLAEVVAYKQSHYPGVLLLIVCRDEAPSLQHGHAHGIGIRVGDMFRLPHSER